MADKTAGELTAAGALDGTEILHVEQGGNSRRTTAQAVGEAGRATAIADAIDASAPAEATLRAALGQTAGGVVVVTGSRSLAGTDRGRYLRATEAATLTLENGTYETGDVVTLRAATSDAVAFAAASGVTINAPYGGSLTLAGEGAAASLVIISATEADLVGQTAAP